MTKEQEEAIEMLEDIKNNSWTTKYIMSSDSAKAETVLNMLKEKDSEIEKKDKIIYEMIGSFIDMGFGFEYCNNDNRCINNCEKCIKQYFERKSEE